MRSLNLVLVLLEAVSSRSLFWIPFPLFLKINNTMKLVIATSLIAGTAAFAPAAKQTSNTALKSYENELGVIVSFSGRPTAQARTLERFIRACGLYF
jgi:hypothetical protein